MTKLLATLVVSGLSACMATAPQISDNEIRRLNSRVDRLLISQMRAIHALRLHQLELARLKAEVEAGPRTAPELRNALRNGVYSCELKRQVEVIDVQPNGRSATVKWKKQAYRMTAVQAQTGAVRLENEATGLVWISVIGKSMLLDTRRGKQLANECNPTDAT